MSESLSKIMQGHDELAAASANFAAETPEQQADADAFAAALASIKAAHGALSDLVAKYAPQ